MSMGDATFFSEEFERFAEKDSEEIFATLANQWITKCSLTEYLIHAEQRIKDEQARLLAIFPLQTQIKLMRICDTQLLAVKQKILLEMQGSGVECLIREEKYDGTPSSTCINNNSDLARVHRLMSRIENGLIPVAQLLQDHIARLGADLCKRHAELASQQADYSKYVKHFLDSYVPELVQLHETLAELTHRAFGMF